MYEYSVIAITLKCWNGRASFCDSGIYDSTSEWVLPQIRSTSHLQVVFKKIAWSMLHNEKLWNKNKQSFLYESSLIRKKTDKRFFGHAQYTIECPPSALFADYEWYVFVCKHTREIKDGNPRRGVLISMLYITVDIPHMNSERFLNSPCFSNCIVILVFRYLHYVGGYHNPLRSEATHGNCLLIFA